MISELRLSIALKIAIFHKNLAFLNDYFQEPECELDIAGFVKSKFDYEPDLYAKVMKNLFF